MKGEWESVDELASRLGVDARTVFGLALTGRIQSQRRGNQLLVRSEGELQIAKHRGMGRLFDRIATKYYNYPVFTVSAGLASILGLGIGLLSLLPLLKPSQPITLKSTTPIQQAAKTGFEAAVLEGTRLTLEMDFIGYQDGGSQFSFGCPGGAFFAVPKSQLGSNQFAKNSESDTDESKVLKRAGAALLGPLIVQIGLDTNLPQQDYLRITSVDVVTLDHRRVPDDPALVVESNPCADADSGEAGSTFLVVLPTRPERLSLVSARWEKDPKPVVIRQDKPSSVRLEITAREFGWYQFTVRVKYSYRGSVFQVSLKESIRAFFPAGASYDWYTTDDGGELRRGTERQMKTIPKELDELSPNGFPPKLASQTTRSGPLVQSQR